MDTFQITDYEHLLIPVRILQYRFSPSLPTFGGLLVTGKLSLGSLELEVQCRQQDFDQKV